MKIEMGESLFYSWLRHVKDCQIVQTNWKPSPQWDLKNYDSIENMFHYFVSFFERTNNYKIFKKNVSVSQIIKQAECDTLGICIRDNQPMYYAVDVAFHENGLNYGTKEETVCKVVAKLIRTAFCLYSFFETETAEIIFASPKINNSILIELIPCVEQINGFFKKINFAYNFRIICNEDFNAHVLQPILLTSDTIADTNELFVRSYQMYTMFANSYAQSKLNNEHCYITQQKTPEFKYDTEAYKELKIGKIAQTVLRGILESGAITNEELELLKTFEYSKRMFDIQFPLLVPSDSNFDKIRYYSNPLIINNQKFYMCSQWYETSANNDRPYLIDWIEKHKSNKG